MLALCLAVQTRADVLYGVQGDVLFRVDTTTRNAAMIGPVGFHVGGLAFGNNSTLYGIATDSPSQLIAINLGTGAGSSIGLTGRPHSYSTGLGNDPTTDKLYGATTEGGAYISSFLVTYSKANGAAASVGNTSAQAIVGLDFDASGQLWGIDGAPGREELIRIDKTSGATAVIGAQGLASYPSIGALDIGPSGTFWAIDASGLTPLLLSINPLSGAPTALGFVSGLSGSGGVTGLASVPEPSALALVIAGLAALAVRRARRG